LGFVLFKITLPLRVVISISRLHFITPCVVESVSWFEEGVYHLEASTKPMDNLNLVKKKLNSNFADLGSLCKATCATGTNVRRDYLEGGEKLTDWCQKPENGAWNYAQYNEDNYYE
jgi:hypothetical protein